MQENTRSKGKEKERKEKIVSRTERLQIYNGKFKIWKGKLFHSQTQQ